MQRLALNSMELEIQRLLQHLDRTQAKRFLVNPEPPSGFAAFSELKDDAIGRAQRAAKKQESEPFYADLNERLAKEEARYAGAK